MTETILENITEDLGVETISHSNVHLSLDSYAYTPIRHTICLKQSSTSVIKGLSKHLRRKAMEAHAMRIYGVKVEWLSAV